MKKAAMFSAGMMIVMISAGVSVLAQTQPVPEIDAGSISSGIGLLTGGILILKSRWAK